MIAVDRMTWDVTEASEPETTECPGQSLDLLLGSSLFTCSVTPKGRSAVLEQQLLPGVELAGLHVVALTDLRHWVAFDEHLPQYRQLALRP